MIDADLERADAQVVAWEADDEELKQIFREGQDIHTENAKAIFKHTDAGWLGLPNDLKKSQRHKAKGGVHAVNYDVKARTLAIHLGITVAEAEDFITRWFDAHPNILKWHKRTRRQINTTRQVTNAFGYRMYFFDRLETLLPRALAWIPQSTVALVTNKGLINIYENLREEVQLLLQVHDSLVMEVLIENVTEVANKIQKEMEIVIPYDDPLTIPVGLTASPKSWGHAEEDGILINGRFINAKPYADDNSIQDEVAWAA